MWVISLIHSGFLLKEARRLLSFVKTQMGENPESPKFTKMIKYEQFFPNQILTTIYEKIVSALPEIVHSTQFQVSHDNYQIIYAMMTMMYSHHDYPMNSKCHH